MFAVDKKTMRLADLNKINNYFGKFDNSKESVFSATCQLMTKAANALYFQVKNFNNVLILCGGGNNGGDGFALAMLLAKSNIDVCVVKTSETTTDVAIHFSNECDRLGVKILNALPSEITKFDCIVDCIYGIGFHGELPNNIAKMTDAVNNCPAKRIACDIPSGLNADNGIADKNCFKADITIALGANKVGYYLNDGKDYCGNIVLDDIGITEYENKVNVADNRCLNKVFAKRSNNCNKGTFGNLVIVADSDNYIGAGLLSYAAAVNVIGESALRMGCGYCRLCVKEKLLAALQSHVVHCCLLPIDSLFDVKASAIAIGMGFDGSENLLIHDVICKSNARLLIDASALNILADNLHWLKNKSCDIIITPHPGEFAKLCKLNIMQVLSSPIELAKDFAKKHNIIVYLKGVSSVVTDGERVSIIANGTPAMAKGGSGDVLSGVIGGVLARYEDIYAAAIASGYLCAFAARKADTNEYALMPMDIANAIGVILKNQ